MQWESETRPHKWYKNVIEWWKCYVEAFCELIGLLGLIWIQRLTFSFGDRERAGERDGWETTWERQKPLVTDYTGRREQPSNRWICFIRVCVTWCQAQHALVNRWEERNKQVWFSWSSGKRVVAVAVLRIDISEPRLFLALSRFLSTTGKYFIQQNFFSCWDRKASPSGH